MERADTVIAPGTLLGSYRIDARLGEGGMGVVYRATDTKLDRPVAIKFLADNLFDANARRRFQREAQMASSLNHPHILAVYDIGEHEDRQYLVTELVDGGTLQDWADAEPHRWRQIVELLVGVADGLAAAHAANILHRDIKPANILLTTNGYAKLADFGLAKLVEDPAAPSRVRARQTATGAIVGTAAYMSPEQALGRPLDARSDIFSFGVLLYELLAGRHPFAGETDVVMLQAVIHSSPEPLPDSIPEALKTVVEKSIEKEPAERYQSMRDLVVDLRRIARKSSADRLPAAHEPPPRRWPAWVPWGLAGLALAALTGMVVASLTRDAAVAPTAATSSPRDFEITQLTASGNAVAPAISPDGRYVAYLQQDAGSPSGGLWVRQVATSSNVPIVPSEAHSIIWAPSVSPDGDFVDFLRAGVSTSTPPTLWRVGFLGGNPRRVRENVGSGVAWSPDGRRMAFVRHAGDSSTLVVVEGGAERVLATRRRPAMFTSGASGRARPAWSPDGAVIAVLELSERIETRVAFVDVTTRAETIREALGLRVEGLAWLGPETLILSQQGDSGPRVQLWRMSYPDGAFSRLTNDLSSYIGVDVDAARESLVTSRRDTRTSLWVGDAAGTRGAEIVPPSPYEGPVPRMLWTEERVLYDGDGASIKSIARGGGTPEEVVAGAVHVAATANGGTVVFVNGGLSKISPSSRSPVQLVPYVGVIEPVVSADDRYVVFLSNERSDQSVGQAPWIVSIDGGDRAELVHRQANSVSVDVSKDDRLLFVSSNDGKRVFVVCDLPKCTSPVEIDAPENFRARSRWTPDGQSIAYVDTSGANVWSIPLAGGSPRPITSFTDTTLGRSIANFAWSRDGEHLAVLHITTTEDIVLLRGL